MKSRDAALSSVAVALWATRVFSEVILARPLSRRPQGGGYRKTQFAAKKIRP
jgi:hypothetical protein